ncbi:MAG: helix-hairpin-helix domain-containing protein [Rubrivivax sp.]|nr:helix-hairpin-helix domain-containing protein [Rubrivivax sp.]
MPQPSISIILLAAVALLGGSPCLAADKAAATSPAASQARMPPTKAPKPVDINSASRAQLKTLPGIGDAEAGRIIAARPYLSKARLLADKVVSEEVYLGLKGRIIAMQKAQPGTKAGTKAQP